MLDQSSTRPVPHEDFTVGDWLVEASLDRLSRADAVVHLRPQLTDLLVVLARRAGRTVPKHVLLAEVWGSEYVGESALTRCIAEIRQALRDDARRPTIILTIPKRGYRLVAPVAFLPSAPPAATPESRTLGLSDSRTPFPPGAVGTHGSPAGPETTVVAPHGAEATREAVARPWLRDTRWHLLLALAIVIALALAAGRCGPRDAAAGHPALSQMRLQPRSASRGRCRRRAKTEPRRRGNRAVPQEHHVISAV